MPLKLNSSGGGSVTLDVPSTASDFTVTVPASSATLATTNGGNTIEFGAGSASAPSITTSGDTNTGIAFPAADTVAIGTGGTERMRLDASGNVGIGTSSPGFRLDVRDASNTTVHVMGNTSGVRVGASADTPVASAGFVGTYSSHPLTLGTNNAERARIDTNGNFMVGRTNVSFGASTGVWIDPAGAGVFERDSESCLFLARVGGNSNGSVANFYWGSGRSFVGSISVQSTSTSFNTSSDYRLKENVVPLTGAAARVLALKPCRFNFIAEPGRIVDGFIAHEAAEIVPEAVTGEKDAVDADGRIAPQGIDQSKLVPLLTAALQEALTEIAALKARVAALESTP